MPKISAPTVREHHERVKARLVEGTERILRESGPQALNAAAVAHSAGIARNSIYRYVDSVDDLRLLVLARCMPRWRDAVFSRVDEQASPERRLAQFMVACVEQTRDPSHGWFVSLARYSSSSKRRRGGPAAGDAAGKRRAGGAGIGGASCGMASVAGGAVSPVDGLASPAERLAGPAGDMASPADGAGCQTGVAHGQGESEGEAIRRDVVRFHAVVDDFLAEQWRELGAADAGLWTGYSRALLYEALQQVEKGTDAEAVASSLRASVVAMAEAAKQEAAKRKAAGAVI